MATITDYKGNRDDLTKCEYSGLMNYLFGKNRDKQINCEKFKQLQRDLMDDILWLEFCRYSEDGKTISDLDLCNHLLCCANLTSKQCYLKHNNWYRKCIQINLKGQEC